MRGDQIKKRWGFLKKKEKRKDEKEGEEFILIEGGFLDEWKLRIVYLVWKIKVDDRHTFVQGKPMKVNIWPEVEVYDVRKSDKSWLRKEPLGLKSLLRTRLSGHRPTIIPFSHFHTSYL